jgi:uncharacterized protein (DUF58 family)
VTEGGGNGSAPRSAAPPDVAAAPVRWGPQVPTGPVAVRLRWWPAPATAAGASVAAAALLVALVSRRAEMLILAAGPLALLASAPRTAPPQALEVTMRVSPARVAETDEFTLFVAVGSTRPLDHLAIRLVPGMALSTPTDEVQRTGAGTHTLQAQWSMRPARWGRWPIGTVQITALGAGRTLRATTTIDTGTYVVYPAFAPPPVLPRPFRLPRLAGDHVAAEPGSGVEFAGSRPYQPGDPARLVHWSASARRGRLQVTERYAERLADVVLVVDGYSDVGPPGSSSLDVSVRIATGLAAGYLRGGDRVGAILLSGGAPRFVPIGLGRTQLTRIVEMFLEARRSVGLLTADLDLVPRQALPPGALVLVASPLLDDRTVTVLTQLRERGSPTALLDVLDSDPDLPPGAASALALRIWRLDRRALVERLHELGVVVVGSSDPAELAARLVPLRRLLLSGSRR